MMRKLKITPQYAKEFDEKCARVDAHGFLKFIGQIRDQEDSLLNVLELIEKAVITKPYQETNRTYDSRQFDGLINEFFQKHFPSKAKEVSQILDGTNPYFIDESGKSHIKFLPAEKGKSSSVGHSNNNTYLEFNVYKNNTVWDMVTTVHEISHALSKHHKRVIECIRSGGSQKELDALTRKKGFDRDCIGEIESNIVERLFVKFLSDKGILQKEDLDNYENLQRLSLCSEINLIKEESEILKRLPCPVTRESLEKLVSNLAKEGNKRLLERVEKMHDDDKNSPYMFRYVVGRLVAHEWLTEFKDSIYQEDWLKKFCVYWDNTDRATLDDACHHLLELNPLAIAEVYLLDREEEGYAESEIE